VTPAPDALPGPAEIRGLADSLGVRPTKSLGQNFVHDANTVRRIVRTAGLAPAQRVLEVGPGLGSLTLGLLADGHPVTAIEVDPVLAAALPETVATRYPDAPLTVVTGDALRVTQLPAPRGAETSAATSAPTALVANLPYNVAVPVVLHLLEAFPSLSSGLVLVQDEVAERLAAGPGSRVYGVPSVKIAWYAAALRAGTVARTVFWPIPNVDSGLIRLVRHDPPATSATRAEVFAVVDAAFAQRRKTLRAALAGWAGSATRAEDALRAAGIAPAARGETLDVAAFARLAEHGPGGTARPRAHLR
jgi:16S rRNA (adenine1518-N6/adenine1519-N6)-dimethyltransferase